MVRSSKGYKESKKFSKVPTEESWSQLKEEMHGKAEKLPFIKKLQILNALRMNEIKWRKPRVKGE